MGLPGLTPHNSAEEEEEEELEHATSHECAHCDETICFVEEISLLEIVEAHKYGADYSPFAIHSDEGEYLFRPLFLHFACWESLLEDVEPPLERTPRRSAGGLFCKLCKRGIPEGSIAGTMTFGEFHVSRRAPNGVHGEHFHEAADPDFYCMPCMKELSTLGDLWDELEDIDLGETHDD